MASLSREKSRNGYRLQFYLDGQRKKSIWLGDLSKKQAETIKTHVEYLIVAKKSGLPAPSQTAEWLGQLLKEDEGLFDRLALTGLVQIRPKKNQQTVQAYVQGYIDSQVSKRPATIKKYTQTLESLIGHFTGDRMMDSITSADAERWREWMLASGNRLEKDRSALAENTVRRRTGIAKQFFNRAIKDGLITQNPFDGLACSVGADEQRQYFVERSVIDRVIAKAPDVEWRAFLALARYGGLRCPSEPLILKWEDVSFAERCLTIDSPKTGVRVCPIFPELLPFIEELAIQARSMRLSPTDFVFQNRRGSEAVWRSGLLRLLKKCGIAHWPKLFQNLRATRETELLAQYPAKDVVSWIGNSQAVAMKHYAMARSSVFATATGLDILANPASQQPSNDAESTIDLCSTCGDILEQLRSILCSIHDSQQLPDTITVKLKPKHLLYKNEKTQAIELIDWASIVGDTGPAEPCGIIGISESGQPVVLQVVMSRDVRASLTLSANLRASVIEATR